MKPCIIVCFLWILLTTSNISIVPIKAQSSDNLLIFAASSLTDAFTDLAQEFETSSDIQVTLNLASSSTLSAQLSQGAPADIFASANLLQIQNLVDDDLINQASVSIFAENELVLITPIDNPADIQSVEDIAEPDVLLVLGAQSVPIRDYTNILLDNLELLYKDNFTGNVTENIVSEELNVRQVVTRVALGEADAGIVYRTDITEDIIDSVQIIPLPINSSPRASYYIAPLIESNNPSLANQFIDFVFSDEGQAILQEWEFCAPETPYPEITPEPEETSEPDDIQSTQESC
ncbi:MAG: molybdate ABC transporter substrate-binding protein [Phototrophicaceae bacterium]